MNNPIRTTLMVIAITSSLLAISPTTLAQEPELNIPAPRISASNFLYLPAVMKIVDLTIDSVEITQAVQTDSNSVTLVADRQTVARVYTRAISPMNLSGVYVSISAYQSGSELPDSPFVLGPGTSPTSWSRADIDTSFNTLLPSTWLSDNITLRVTVDPSNAIDENNETNNMVSKTLNFTSVPALDIKVIPIRYTHNPTGRTYPPPSASFIQEAFERFYPVSTVNLTIRSVPYSFSGDLTKYNSWANLLDAITAMKTYDAAPESQVFYGLIPLLDHSGKTWWYGGYAGLGWLGYRESIGLTDAYINQLNYYFDGKRAANHEVGHNFGRDHAPCGDSGSIDSDYPYPGGIVGQYGFNLNAWQVIPTSYKDIMSYCTPNWVSDYTYLGLLQNQLIFGNPEEATQVTESLYIRADINDDGTANLQPVYTIPASPDEIPIESEYSLEFIDANGVIVAAHPVAERLAEENDFQAQSIHVKVPKPTKPFSRLRLTKNGSSINDRKFVQSNPLKAVLPEVTLDNGEFVLDWGTPQIPAMVRYTTDQGESWTTLGFDIIGGEFRMDAQLLPIGSLLFEIRLADTTEPTLSTIWEHLP